MAEYFDWLGDISKLGEKIKTQTAFGSLERDYTMEEEAKYDEQVEREESLSSSLGWGGGIGALLGIALLTAATGGLGGLLAGSIPASQLALAGGLGGGLGAAAGAWTGESAEGLAPGLFEQHTAQVAEDEYFDRLRSGVVDTGLTTGLLSYGLGNVLGGSNFMDFAQHGTRNAPGLPNIPRVSAVTPSAAETGVGLVKKMGFQDIPKAMASRYLGERTDIPSGLVSTIMGDEDMSALDYYMLSRSLT
jgi:hypothetical protein